MRRLTVVAVIAVLGISVLPGTAAAAKLGPAPVVADCLGYRGPSQCIYNIGFIEMRLSSHIVHVGEKLTAQFNWGLTPTRGALPLLFGAGLSKAKCSGLPKVIALGSTGAGTCTWKATAATPGWQTSLGINLSQNASLGSYTENDFYTVIGKQSAIEGWVRREDSASKKAGYRPGIPNIQVKINGPKFGRSIRTNENGYFFTTVQKAGAYRVTPVLPKKYKAGKSNAVAIDPESKVVHVSGSDVGSAEFKVRDGIKVTATPSRTAVPADGQQGVTVDITAERFGDPLPDGSTLSIVPNKESAGANPQTVPVPARYCNQFGVAWPTGDRATNMFQAPFPVYTDAKGHATMSLQTGTVPGKLSFYAWARDASGSLETDSINDARAEVTIDNQSTGSGDPRAIGKPLGAVAKEKNLANPGSIYSLRDLLVANAGANPGLGGLAFAVVYGSQMYGVLAMPQTERIEPAADGTIPGSAGSTVIPAEYLDGLLGKLYGGPTASGWNAFWPTVLGGAMPAPPPFASFAAGSTDGSTTGWSLTPQNGKVTSEGGFKALGYPYAAVAGGC